MDTSGDAPTMKYSKLTSLCNKYRKKMKPVLKSSENQTRAARGILNSILTKRHTVDVSPVVPSWIQFAIPGNDTMYVVTNEDGGGQNIVMRLCVALFGSRLSKNKTKRNPSIAVRLAAALCDSTVHDAAKHFLSGKKTRDNQDQVSPVDLAFGCKILDILSSPSFHVERPDVMDNDDVDPHGKISPNQCDYQGKDINKAWILDTWKSYVKPKFKKTLTKWWENTGGGP
jgi:hypothetical protein